MNSYFSKHYNEIKYPKADEEREGLRNAQLGAIHSISSFFTLGKTKAAVVVMPTGSGKTAVLMMTPYVLEANKVLVVTPSKLVRNQISGEYSTLKTLTKLNVLDEKIKKPKVFEMKSLYKVDHDNQIENSDIIVATPQVGLSLSRVENIRNKIDLVLIDEAHHVPAKTWTEILENINEAKHILFTATPFRMDNKTIKGVFVYNYPLSQAYKDGIFGESYRISSGADVSQAIDPSTGRLYSSGHVFCKAIQGDQQITIGYSSGSKIWSSSYANLKDFVSWCDLNGIKIVNSEMKIRTNTNFDFLPIPKKLEAYPPNIYFADLSGESYTNPQCVIDKSRNSLGIVTDLEFKIINIENDMITLKALIGEKEQSLICDINGNYKSEEEEILIFLGRQKIGLSSYLSNYPLIFCTTDDVIIQGNEVSEGDPEAIVFTNDNIITIPWKEKYDANVSIEFRTSKTRKKGKSIQDALLEILLENVEVDYIIYDHSTGEIADFISIQNKEMEVEVTLYHVKAMSGKNYNSSMKDISEVASQAIKSMTWLKTKSIFLEKIKSRRKSNHCVFKKGKHEDLVKDVRLQGKMFRGKIVVVQPSICKSKAIPSKIQEVLAATNYYISNSGIIKTFEIWGS